MPHSIIQLKNGDGEMLFPRSTDVNNVYHDNIPLGDYLLTIKSELIKKFYPVGSILILSTSTDPSTVLEGTTWTRTAKGRILVGCGYLDNNTANTQVTPTSGPSGAYTVTLTTNQIPSHNHKINMVKASSGSSGKDYGGSGSSVGAMATGGNGAHNNVMPYIVVNIWERTA